MKKENYKADHGYRRIMNPLAMQIRDEFAKSGMTVYRLSKITRLDPPLLHRFLNAGADVTLNTAWRICQALGLSGFKRLEDFK